MLNLMSLILQNLDASPSHRLFNPHAVIPPVMIPQNCNNAKGCLQASQDFRDWFWLNEAAANYSLND
jgi:hypothetical protein